MAKGGKEKEEKKLLAKLLGLLLLTLS